MKKVIRVKCYYEDNETYVFPFPDIASAKDYIRYLDNMPVGMCRAMKAIAYIGKIKFSEFNRKDV